MNNETKIEILNNNLGKEVTVSAGYNDTTGNVYLVDSKKQVAVIKTQKHLYKWIDINAIYEIEVTLKE